MNRRKHALYQKRATRNEREGFKARLERVRPYLPSCYGVLVSHHTGLPRMTAYNVVNAGTYNANILEAMEELFLPKKTKPNETTWN
jgi:hypothetical protein